MGDTTRTRRVCCAYGAPLPVARDMIIVPAVLCSLSPRTHCVSPVDSGRCDVGSTALLVQVSEHKSHLSIIGDYNCTGTMV